MGLVVAIDSFYGRKVYTIDDSTGACIECSVVIPPPAQVDGGRVGEDAQKPVGAGQIADPYADIDVGMVVDVKGNLRLFRDQKQIKIQKMQRVRSTNREVQFWEKIREFKTDVLGKPWVLERKVLRRLEKENKSDADSKARERRRKKQKEEGRKDDRSKHRSLSSHVYRESGSKKPYRPSKLSSVATAEEGQYDALGL